MTRGEQFVEALPGKLRFYDRNERRSYELTRAVAARLVDDPGLVQQGLILLSQMVAEYSHKESDT